MGRGECGGVVKGPAGAVAVDVMNVGVGVAGIVVVASTVVVEPTVIVALTVVLTALAVLPDAVLVAHSGPGCGGAAGPAPEVAEDGPVDDEAKDTGPDARAGGLPFSPLAHPAAVPMTIARSGKAARRINRVHEMSALNALSILSCPV